MHLREALGRFTLQLQADGRSAHTIGQYERHGRLLITWLATERLSCEVEDIDHETLAHFLASEVARLRGDGIAKKASSVNALRTSTRVFFGHLHRAGYVASDPARLLRLARCGPPPPRGLSDAEEAKLFAVLREATGTEAHRDRVLVELMLATGLRLGSAIGLDVTDVDLAAGELHVRVAKGARPQTTFLSPRVVPALQEFIGDRCQGPLFTTSSGRRVSIRHAQRRFKFWRERGGLPNTVSPHSLRHTFAQRLYHATSDLFLVQAALHHRSVTSTTIYARVNRTHLRDAVSEL